MIPAEDFEEFDILSYLLEAIAFLSRAESSAGCAFVHCNYGVNRSGVVAAAYLMVSERKPLLQVVNELKARRSLILSNVGFRRQLVRFARCRGLLDAVERPSRRSPRLEHEDRTPREVTPSRDKTTDETKDEPSDPESTETNAEKEVSAKNGDVHVPPVNGYHATPPSVLSVSTDHVVNGVQSINGFLRPRPNTSRRERLLRDIDSTIETLSVREGNDANSTYYTYYRPRGNIDRVVTTLPPRPTTYLPVIDYTSDPLPVRTGPLISPSPQFEILDHPHSSDSDKEFTASSVIGDRSASFYDGAEPSNAVLDEYLRYKNASAVPAALSVHVPPPSAAEKPFTSTVKPRSHYSRPSATASSAIEDYDEADMSSFLAQRNARRPFLSSRNRLDQALTSLDLRRRSASSTDAILQMFRPYSARKSPVSLATGYRQSAEVTVLPAPAYAGRWYPTLSTSAGRQYTAYVMGMTSFDAGRYDSDDDVGDDPISGHRMRSVGRVIATRVTPAPGYGPRSNYARSHSMSRLM